MCIKLDMVLEPKLHFLLQPQEYLYHENVQY